MLTFFLSLLFDRIIKVLQPAQVEGEYGGKDSEDLPQNFESPAQNLLAPLFLGKMVTPGTQTAGTCGSLAVL